MRESAEESAGIILNWETINNLQYVDNTVMLADNFDVLQRLLERIKNSCKSYGLDMNLKITKIVATTTNGTNHFRQHINIDNEVSRSVFIKMKNPLQP